MQADLLHEHEVTRRCHAGGVRPGRAARGREPGRRLRRRGAAARDHARGLREAVPPEPAPHVPRHARRDPVHARRRRRLDRVRLRARGGAAVRRRGRLRVLEGGGAGASRRRSRPTTATEGVRCNAVLPSVVDTPANRDAQPDADHSRWVRSGGDRRGDPLPVLGRVGSGQRRRCAGLRRAPRACAAALATIASRTAGP